LEDDDPPAPPGQPLGEGGAAGAAADDQHVDLLALVEAGHGLAAGDAAALGVEQPGGVVLRRPAGPAQDGGEPGAHAPSTSRSATSFTGSVSNSGGFSQCSRSPAP